MRYQYIIYLVSLGLIWAPLPAMISTLTTRWGVRPYGDSAWMVYLTSILGDIFNLVLVSVPLAIVIALSRWSWPGWRLGLVLAPAFIWACVDFWPYLELQDQSALITPAFYLPAIILVPALVAHWFYRWFGTQTVASTFE